MEVARKGARRIIALLTFVRDSAFFLWRWGYMRKNDGGVFFFSSRERQARGKSEWHSVAWHVNDSARDYQLAMELRRGCIQKEEYPISVGARR